MRRKKLRIAAICVMGLAGLMLASCGVADVVTQAVTEAVQEATGMAIDEMGGGPVVTLGYGNMANNEGLYVSLVNNAVSVQTHTSSEIRIDFSPPTTGRYVVPDVEFVAANNRFEVIEPSGNITFGSNYRPGVVRVYLPENIVAGNLDLRATNGAVRIVGNDSHLADFVSITVVNGIIELRDFSTDDVLATSTNGTINANSLTAGNLELRTTNGIITARDSAVSGNLVARTINGGVTLENVDADMGRADVNAVNGHVSIR